MKMLGFLLMTCFYNFAHADLVRPTVEIDGVKYMLAIKNVTTQERYDTDDGYCKLMGANSSARSYADDQYGEGPVIALDSEGNRIDLQPGRLLVLSVVQCR